MTYISIFLLAFFIHNYTQNDQTHNCNYQTNYKFINKDISKVCINDQLLSANDIKEQAIGLDEKRLPTQPTSNDNDEIETSNIKQILSQIQLKEKQLESNPTSYPLKRQICEYHFILYDKERAFSCIKELEIHHPSDEWVKLNLGNLLQEKEEFSQALDYYLSIDSKDIDKLFILHKIAEIYEHLNRYDEQLDILREIVRYNPDNYNVYHTIIERAFKKNNQYLLAKSMVNYLYLKEFEPSVYDEMIRKYYQTGREFLLELIYDQLSNVSLHRNEININLAVIYMREKKTSFVKFFISKALKEGSETSKSLYDKIFRIHYDTGDSFNAVEILKLSYGETNESYESLLVYAKVCLCKESFRDAKQYIEKALLLKNLTNGLLIKAVILEKLDDLSDALRVLKEFDNESKTKEYHLVVVQVYNKLMIINDKRYYNDDNNYRSLRDDSLKELGMSLETAKNEYERFNCGHFTDE